MLLPVQVTWLASWTENVQGQVKYVMLNPSSKLKGEKDWQKYETARKLAKCIGKIRQEYQDDFKSKEMRIRQRAVALYFIDKVNDICVNTYTFSFIHYMWWTVDCWFIQTLVLPSTLLFFICY